MDLIRKICWLAVMAVLISGIASCKKSEEEETTTESMSGSVVFDIPYYVLKGETVTMSASGVLHPRVVSYKWYVSGVYSDSLSADRVTVRFPDSIGVFAVSAFATAPGFYNLVYTRAVTTVDTTWNSSLIGLRRGSGYFTDPRDGHSYGYVTVGGLDWFNQNLAWQGTGVPFQASPATSAMFGSFYTWNEAMQGNVCPEGWSIPTQSDWESLAAALNGGVALPFLDNWAQIGSRASAEARLNEERMWPYSPDNTHTNEVGWNALPLGYSFASDSDFSGFNEYGCWWSATEKNADQAYYRYIWYDRGDFPMSYTGKNDLRASVRCVRTHPQSL